MDSMVLVSGPRRVLVVLFVTMMVIPAVPLGGPTAPASAGTPPAPRATPLAAAPANQWPMFAHDPSHSGLDGAQPKGLPVPGAKWDRSLAVESHGTVIANFTRNVKATSADKPWTEQLQCAVFSVGPRVYVLDGADGSSVWVLNMTGTFPATPAVGDVNGDGRTEVVLASLAGVLYAYEPVIYWNGTEFTWRGNNTAREQLWNTSARSVGTVSFSSLVLEDLSGNGTLDVVLGSSQGVYCLNARYGNELWNRTVSGFSVSTPAVYRVGTQRNVIATSYNQTTAPVEMHVYTMKGTTGAVIKHLSLPLSVTIGTFLPPSLPYLPSPAAGNLDGLANGDELVVIQPYVSDTARVLVFSNGDLDYASLLYNKSLGGTSALEHICHATPVIGDVDGDGELELVIESWHARQFTGTNTYTNVTCLDGASGAVEWSINIDDTIGLDYEWALASPVLCDLNRDRLPDVLVMQYNGRLDALSGKNGTRLWHFDTRGHPIAFVSTSPAAGDLDHDGYTDVVVNGQAISVLLPDLAIAPADITFTDPAPDEGEVVGIDVLVHNRGNADAHDVLVSVLDWPQLAGNATIATVVAGGSYSARVTWQFFGRVDRTVIARVDPLNAIEELREDNNNASVAIKVHSFYGITIGCPNNETIIDPGTTWHYFADVRNVGKYGNRIAMSLTGAPASWTVGVSPDTFTLGPAGSASDRVTVDVSVRTDPSTPAGEYPIVLTATSLNDTRDNDSAVLTTVVKGRWGVHLTPTERDLPVAPGDAVVYKLNATNIGNAVDSFTVQAVPSAPDPAWGVNLFPPRIDGLAPDASREISLSVSAPFDALEGQSYTVVVRVASVGDPSRFDESRTVSTVVVPDIAVTGLVYRRADGSEVDGSTKHLVLNETSHLGALVTNLRGNVGISDLRVRFVVDGTDHDVTLQDLPASGVVESDLDYAFASTGVHQVVAIADPYEIISDVDRGNNQVSGNVGVKDTTPVGPFDIEGIVYRPDLVTPVPSATVRVGLPRTAYAFSVVTDASGLYTASLPDSRYSDGDDVVLNATDGRDYGQRTVKAYSEDRGARVDLVLAAGVHYDVALRATGVSPVVETGAVARLPFTLASVGNRGATVQVSVATTGWGATVLNSTGSPVSTVAVAAGGSVPLSVELRVPPDAKGGATCNITVTATTIEDAAATAVLDMNATVRAHTGFSMAVTASPAGSAHPGDVRNHTLTLRNLGNVDDVINLTSDAAMSGWNVRFSQNDVPLPAFSILTVRVTLTVPPGTDAGQYEIALSGQSLVNSTVVNNTYLTESVESLHRAVELTPVSRSQQAKPGETARWSITVRNDGNVADVFDLEVIGLGTGYSWRFVQDTAQIEAVGLGAGGSTVVIVEVNVPSTFTSAPASTTLDLSVKATSEGDATASGNAQLTLQLKGILDLSLQVDTSTNSPKAGGHVVFTLTVTNTGPDDATGVVVYAYLGEASPTKKTIGDIKVSASSNVSITRIDWFPTKAGTVNVRIVLNPLNQSSTIFELDRSNNEWDRTFKVAPATSGGLLQSPLTWAAVIVVVLLVFLAYWLWPRREEGAPEEEDEGAEEVEASTEVRPQEAATPKAAPKRGGGGKAQPAPPPAGRPRGPSAKGPVAGTAPAGKTGPTKGQKGKRPPQEEDGSGDDLKNTMAGGRM